MCGIAGVINKKKNSVPVEKYLRYFSDVIYHRGPDDEGIHRKDNIYGFLNRRLAIVDIASGNQPIYNERRTIGIVFNGEIYNYLPIRKELQRKGYKFKTKSDTEVILRGFEEWGVDIFEKLNGMFAVCMWNSKTDEVFLARDHFGIKPLYIYQDDKKILFSSEIKALIALPEVDDSLNPIGFQDYLSYRYVLSPYTLFKRITRLEAGTYMHIKNGVSSVFRYWDVSYTEPYNKPSINEVKKQLTDKIKNAVSSQLMGEVPVGVLLSGGIDSSTIAYMIHKLGANLMTFNIGFPEVNEFEYSRAVAKKFGLKHIEITTTVQELVSDFDKINLALDEPVADAACLPLYKLCEVLKKHVTVVLSGEGGDEVFAGYPQYHYLLSNLPEYKKRFKLFFERSWYFQDAQEFIKDQTIPPLHLRFQKYFEEQSVLNGMLSYDMRTWMPENLMMKADKILMAHSLEGRFPFLDRYLFDYVAQLPQEYKLSPERISKWILKEIMKDYLPEKIVDRPKMGFTVPVGTLLKKMKSKVLDTTNSVQNSALSDILETKKIKNFVEGYYAGKHERTLQTWTFFVLSFWFQNSIKEYKKLKRLLPARQ